MVDSIGIKAGTVVDRRSAPVVSTATAPVSSITASQPQAQDVSSANQIAQALATEAPVDSDRVARIRDAVQEGRFSLAPSTTADALLALKQEWNPNDKA